MIRFLRKLVFIAVAIICCWFTYLNKYLPIDEVSNELRLLDEYVQPYYESTTSNTGFTNINGISNVYVNMLTDGFDVYKSDVTNSYIDISFTNDDGEAYRYYFERISGKVTFFYSDYERSELGLSYIIERKE